MKALKRTLFAYAVWALSCSVGCDETPRVYVTSRAREQINSLYERSLRAHAERVYCNHTTGETLDSLTIAPWQVVTPDGSGVQLHAGECTDGNTHSHILPDSSGGIDSIFSKGDIKEHAKDELYCLTFRKEGLLCSKNGVEQKVIYVGK